MAQHSTVAIYGTLDEAVAAVRSLGTKLPFALLGGSEEGVVGPVTGVVGWLYQLGLLKDDVDRYAEAIKGGKVVIVVHGSKDTATGGHDALAGSRAERLDLHPLATS